MIAQVDYTDTHAGNQCGWVFDYDVSSNPDAQKVLASPDAFFKLASPKYGDVLVETDYYFATNQQAIYTEQFGSGTEFLNQGTTEPAVAAQAQAILQATDPAIWMSIHYMPRTRDMSASRRQLLRAWCRAVLAAGSGGS